MDSTFMLFTSLVVGGVTCVEIYVQRHLTSVVSMSRIDPCSNGETMYMVFFRPGTNEFLCIAYRS